MASLWKKIAGIIGTSFGIGTDNTVKVGRSGSGQLTFDDQQVPSQRNLEDLLFERLLLTSDGKVIVTSDGDLVLRKTEDLT